VIAQKLKQQKELEVRGQGSTFVLWSVITKHRSSKQLHPVGIKKRLRSENARRQRLNRLAP
jgi:hypothetical protein